MCGLVGYVTGANAVDLEKYFKDGLVVDMIRGFDSTGVVKATVDDWQWFKKATNGADFIQHKGFVDMLRSTPLNRPLALLGHNRAATIGKVIAENAHPFHCGDLIGMHNGTLRKYTKLAGYGNFTTDSETLIDHISKHGIDDALNKIEGAYALVLYDTKRATVSFIRNSERPLAIAPLKDRDGILYASEPGMIRWLAARHGIKLETMFEPKENVLLEYSLDAKEVYIPDQRKLNAVSEYPQYKAPTYSGARQGNYGNSRKSAGYTGTEFLWTQLGVEKNQKINVIALSYNKYNPTSEQGRIDACMVDAPYLPISIHGVDCSKFDEVLDKEFSAKLIGIESGDGTRLSANGIATLSLAGAINVEYSSDDDEVQMFIGPQGLMMTAADIYQLTRKGCYMCGMPISPKDYDDIEWHDAHPVCGTCIADYEQRNAQSAVH